MNRWKLDNKGVTLVELLATLAIVGVIAALGYGVLFQGYANYERIKTETELRDEADLIMASFIRELFVLKESEVNDLKLACIAGSPDSYLVYTKENSSQPVKTGFVNGEILIAGTALRLENNNVSIVLNDCSGSPADIRNAIKTSDPNLRRELTVLFTLTTTIRGEERQLTFENSVSIISDGEEGVGNEATP